MSLDVIAVYAVAALLMIGTIFTLVAAIGLLKLNDAMTRLHAPTKAGTVGIGAYLLASMLHSFVMGQGSFHELLIVGFLFLTAPVSANFMAKVNIHTGATQAPPDPPRDDTWSTLDVPAADLEYEEMKDD